MFSSRTDFLFLIEQQFIFIRFEFETSIKKIYHNLNILTIFFYNIFMQKKIDITILCKVVDNFGDIGVVLRLSKALLEVQKQNSAIFPEINIRIVSDNLKSFSLLEPKINENLDVQSVLGFQVFNWENDANLEYFQKNPPEVILECFQCGRPSWLETLLFDIKVQNIVQIVMIDYLSAEDYAETFHLLQSLTRSARVKKINFMPGFTQKTGGLIFYNHEIDFLEGVSLPLAPELPLTLPPLPGQSPRPQRDFSKFQTIFFSYPHDFSSIIKAFIKFNKKIGGKFLVNLAQGAGFLPFQNEYKKFSSSKDIFDLKTLDFLPQEKWDELLKQMPLLFIRGEDSLARACLYGRPFVWHAYIQEENYQIVKVKALLEKLRPFFPEEHFSKIEKLYLVYNGSDGNLCEAIFDFLSDYENLTEGFFNFSRSLKKNGNLAFHLMTFISKNYII